MKIELPEFYVALSLAEAWPKPTEADLELIRLKTSEHIVQCLRTHFSTLLELELTFSNLQSNTNKPEPRFQIYWESKVSVTFACGSDIPGKSNLFEKIVSAFNRDYLINVVRKPDSPSSLSSAVEVQAQRLKHATEGGAVKVPAFYMGFVCSEEPQQEPTSDEKDKLLQQSHAAVTAQMKQVYPDDFQELISLKIVKTAIGPNAGKPEEKFNLYIEFEAIATFVQNAPQPMDVFRALSSCLTTEFILGLRTIGGSFAFIVEMAIRICVFIEFPELVIVPPGDGEGEPIIIKVYIEFFVALVVRMLEKAPDPFQLAKLDKLFQDFFSSTLAASFPAGFVDMVLEPDYLFEAGMPLPRFNSLHQFKATLQFYDPPPDGSEILSKILQCNVGALFDKLRQLPSPWNNIGEVTLGTAVEKPTPDQAYGGKLEIEKEEKMEEPPPPEEILLPPKPSRPRNEKKKPGKPVPQQPKPDPIVPKNKTMEETVSTSDVFAAFAIPQCEWDPLNRDYKALAETTRDFYASHLRKKFGSIFKEVQVSVGCSRFGSGLPNDNYNVYVEWNVIAHFEGTGRATVPDRHQLCRCLVQADCRHYLLEHVRTLSGTPFAGATGMFTEQVDS